MDSYRPESDRDPVETREWIDSLRSVVDHEGRERARFLLERTIEDGRRQGVAPVLPLNTDYVNTVRVDEQPEFRVTSSSSAAFAASCAGTPR